MDTESNDGAPNLPTFQTKQTEENIKANAIINWITGFFYYCRLSTISQMLQ